MMFYIKHNRIYCLWLNTHMLKSEKSSREAKYKTLDICCFCQAGGKEDEKDDQKIKLKIMFCFFYYAQLVQRRPLCFYHIIMVVKSQQHLLILKNVCLYFHTSICFEMTENVFKHGVISDKRLHPLETTKCKGNSLSTLLVLKSMTSFRVLSCATGGHLCSY